MFSVQSSSSTLVICGRLEVFLKIGVFDSGIGGLPIVERLKEKFPNDEIVFIADTKHMPYGDKDKSLVIKYANNIISKLEKDGAEVIVVACGTVSSLIPLLCHSVQLIGIIEPLCLESCKRTANKKIGVMATVNTVNSESFPSCIHKIDRSIDVYSYACSDLASKIENRTSEEDIMSSLIDPLRYFDNSGIDTLILGCTHYSWIYELIKKNTSTISVISPTIIVNHISF